MMVKSPDGVVDKKEERAGRSADWDRIKEFLTSTRDFTRRVSILPVLEVTCYSETLDIVNFNKKNSENGDYGHLKINIYIILG